MEKNFLISKLVYSCNAQNNIFYNSIILINWVIMFQRNENVTSVKINRNSPGLRDVKYTRKLSASYYCMKWQKVAGLVHALSQWFTAFWAPYVIPLNSATTKKSYQKGLCCITARKKSTHISSSRWAVIKQWTRHRNLGYSRLLGRTDRKPGRLVLEYG